VMLGVGGGLMASTAQTRGIVNVNESVHLHSNEAWMGAYEEGYWHGKHNEIYGESARGNP
jgi:hypothetical protein